MLHRGGREEGGQDLHPYVANIWETQHLGAPIDFIFYVVRTVSGQSSSARRRVPPAVCHQPPGVGSAHALPAPWWQSTPTLTSAATTNGYNVPIVTGDIQEVEVSFPEPIDECDKSFLSGKGHCNIIPEWWCLQECQSSADQQQSSGQTTGLTWGDDQIVVPEAEMWDRESGLTPPAAWLVSTITTPGARLHLLAARELGVIKRGELKGQAVEQQQQPPSHFPALRLLPPSPFPLLPFFPFSLPISLFLSCV